MKKIVRIMALVVAIMVAVGAAGTCEAKSGMVWKTSKAKHGYMTKFYDNGKLVCKVKTDRKLKVKVIKSENLNYNKAVGRYNKYILVEKINGKVVNKNLDGKTADGYYISYKGVKGAKKGNKYTTYCIYDNSEYVDDIIGRIDYRR